MKFNTYILSVVYLGIVPDNVATPLAARPDQDIASIGSNIIENIF
jgi:hypothetical protein